MNAFPLTTLWRYGARTLSLLVALPFAPVFMMAATTAKTPNIVFFAADDLCNWVGPLGGPIRAKTPNLDRLAARGVTFMNAQASGTFCSPARAALFTGRHPATTGVYTTQVYFREHPEIRPLQVALQQGGYETYGTGKLFHHPAGYVDLRGWTDFHVRTQVQKESGWPVDSWKHGAPLPTPMPYSAFTRTYRLGGPNAGFMEYAPLPNEAEKDMADTQQTDWVVQLVKQKHARPFFVGLGLYAPHFPNYAPQKYYDLYPLDEIPLPAIKDNDTDDLHPRSRSSWITARRRFRTSWSRWA